ncbi:MAG TPA: 4Fe-4S dicluster domain-containing protein [Dehalococcoidia bacterium]|nr:4Fe-4S dicluster domain-containing protein [Dehalococcoidia bacterium]
MELKRRDFLKISTGAAGLVLLQPSNIDKVCEAAENSSNEDLAMLVDVSKCIGCWWCYVACKQYNGLPETATPKPDDPPPLAPDTWTTLFTKKQGNTWKFRKQACMHCTDAACVNVCPTGALSHNKLGFVQYERDKCSGCGYCSQYCPFEVPQLQTNKVSGDALMDKCTFCIDRVTNGQQTACSEACPTGAISFGKRKELLEEASTRLAELQKTNPDACLYGANELGGLHVMYILEESPEKQGLPADPKVPAAAMVHDVFQWLGVGAVAAVLAGFGLNYLVARARIAKEEK